MASPARLAALILLALLPLASADVPALVSISGRLTNADGSPLAGPAGLGFTIYNDSLVGAPLWAETQNGVALSNGVFSVLLGSVAPLNLSFNESYWIAITVNGELQNPRLRLAAAPYAVAANRSQNATFADQANRSTHADEAATARDLDCVGCVGAGELATGLSGADIFGDGSDGDVTVSGVTTLAADKFYANLTVSAGATLNTGGYKIFVNRTLTLNGNITANGTINVGAPVGTMGGGAGGGANGHLGGGGGTGGSGGNPGGATSPNTYRLSTIWPFAYQLNTSLQGGAGGGSGAGGSGGAGGGGGGVVLIVAQNISGSGSIQAKGGSGGDGGFGSGGGGGGGGGAIILAYEALSGSIVIDVGGGGGGAGGGGGGTAGSSGLPGKVYRWRVP